MLNFRVTNKIRQQGPSHKIETILKMKITDVKISVSGWWTQYTAVQTVQTLSTEEVGATLEGWLSGYYNLTFFHGLDMICFFVCLFLVNIWWGLHPDCTHSVEQVYFGLVSLLNMTRFHGYECLRQCLKTAFSADFQVCRRCFIHRNFTKIKSYILRSSVGRASDLYFLF